MFKGTEKAFELFEENKSRPILVYFDPDVDGLIAGSLICRYLNYYGIKYSYYINENRKHGFFIDAEKLKGYMILTSDFSILPSQIEDFKKNDVVCINIDHHEIQGDYIEWDKGVIINNQYYFEPEEKRYLSGAGVVYEVLKEWNKDFECKEHMALVGITLLSDVRNIENKGAKEYLEKTYHYDTSEGYFAYLVDKTIKGNYGFGAPRMDRSYIDFTFSPRINSMLRFNENYEAVDFILGKGLDTEDKRDLQKMYAEYLVEIADIQEFTHYYYVRVNKEDIYDTVDFGERGIVDFSGIEPSNFIGLACSRIKDTGKNCVIVLYENGKLKRGSFRGKYDSVPYLDTFNKCGARCAGHSGAFGILDIPTDEEFKNKLNLEIGKLEIGHESTCKIIEISNLSTFRINRGYSVADRNNYVRDCNRTYIKYTGKNISKIRSYGKYIEYEVDGCVVKCFDESLNFDNGLIVPLTEKNNVSMYLRDEKIVL